MEMGRRKEKFGSREERKRRGWSGGGGRGRRSSGGGRREGNGMEWKRGRKNEDVMKESGEGESEKKLCRLEADKETV